jgi:hypothetical protein
MIATIAIIVTVAETPRLCAALGNLLWTEETKDVSKGTKNPSVVIVSLEWKMGILYISVSDCSYTS